MKKSILWCVVLALACGSAQALNYNWVNTTTGAAAGLYNNTANWDLAALPGATDNAFVQNGGAWRVPGGTTSITYGQFVVGGTSSWSIGDPLNLTLNVTSAGGGTGDFIYRSTTLIYSDYQWTWTQNVWGNYMVMFTGVWSGYEYNGSRSQTNLYGTNKAFKDLSNNWANRSDQNIYGSYWDNGSALNYTMTNIITVKPGGQIVRRPGANNSTNASEWKARRFVFQGGQAGLPALGDCVTFTYEPDLADNGPAGSSRLVLAGGVQYPLDVKVGVGYWNGANLKNDRTYTWRFKNTDCNPSPTTVIGRDLVLTDLNSTAGNDGMFINFEENGTLGKVKVRVMRDMTISGRASDASSATRGSTPPTFAERYGFRGKNAEIRIGQNLTIGTDAQAYYAWWPRNGAKVDLGNATITLGQNLAVYRMDPVAKAFWSAGTSTVICDGNGTGKTQQIRTFGIADRVKLNNFIVRNPGGVVVLENALMPQPPGVDPRGGAKRPYLQGGDLLLTGNLSVECGTFRTGDTGQPGRQIMFTGGSLQTLYVDPSATIQGTVGTVRTNGVFDNMILDAGAQVKLLSNITVSSTDNFIMLTGSKLFLNGFTLMGEGQTWISNQVSATGVAWDQGGTIYGTLSVPEPATLLLLGSGVLGVCGWVRRRRIR